MSNQFEADYQAAQNRHKEMTNEAIYLRGQALDNYQYGNFEEVIDIGQKFLLLIQKLPEMALNVYCQVDCEMYSGDLVIYTASIFNFLHLSYFKQNRLMEALACFQQVNKIISQYKLVNPNQAKEWLEYRFLLESLENIYSELKVDLSTYTSKYKQANFLDENLKINRDIVLNKYPLFEPQTLRYLENYNPLLFQKKLRNKSDLSSQSSSCFIATAAYSTSIHPDLDTFRNFRDKQLLTNPLGKWLVSLYYRISPSIAQYIEKQPVIKRFLRQQLSHLAQWMRSQDVTEQ